MDEMKKETLQEEKRQEESKPEESKGNMERNDCYLYKVQDVELQVSLAERIFGLGTVACYTGDNTHPQLFLAHIKHSKEIKNYILKASEEARRRRRTLNTLNIDASDIEEIDA